MHSIVLQRAIEGSARISDFIRHTLGEQANVDFRGRLAMVYLSLSLEHREAILLLVQCGASASATALQRPLLEAFIAGAWVDGEATDEEIQALATFKRPPPTVERMVQRLRKTHAFGKWFEVLRKHYGILGDYAHGHSRQLSRWLGADSVEPRYSDEQMMEVLRHSDIVGLLAAIHREKVSGRPIDGLGQALDALILRREYPGAIGGGTSSDRATGQPA